jgi:KipI family sensor histidine kinase inhibitor
MTAPFTVRPAGPTALLVEFENGQRVRDYYREAQRRQVEGKLAAGIELIPAASTILFDGVADRAALAGDLRRWRPAGSVDGISRLVELPTSYDGPDLAVVAELWRVSIDDVVRIHTGLEHEVAFIGFAPGFAYIAGLPPELRVPRRATPRTAVPAGSVALADQFTGVYPRQTPGGWQLIGRTEVQMWDVQGKTHGYLAPGDRVRFRAMNR